MAADTTSLIEKQLEDENIGAWSRSDDGLNVYTPKPSFFDKVTPHDLLSYFLNADPAHNVRLHLP